MDLLKYLEPMKNLPNRFSNLAFWRGVRKLKDEVVTAFEYVGEWGNGIEGDIVRLENTDDSLDSRISALEDGGGSGGGSGIYVKSSMISLTKNVEYYPQDLSVRILTLKTDSNGKKEIYPILSITGDSLKINLSTEKTSVVQGKHIDAITVEYLTTANTLVQFEMPAPIFKDVVFGGFVNGCSIPQCSVLSCRFDIDPSELLNFENMRLNNVNIYYH